MLGFSNMWLTSMQKLGFAVAGPVARNDLPVGANDSIARNSNN